jgi:hypothetical protein
MKKSEAEKEQFDGEMVVIADGEFKFERQFHSMLQSRITGEVGIVDSMLPIRAIEKREILKRMEAGKNQDNLEETREKSRGFNRQLKSVVGKEMTEIIIEGRLKIAFLIDSNGGDVIVFDIYNEALRSIEDRGGLSQSFVTGTAASAAFYLMTATREAYVLNKTSLIWHHSDDGVDLD